MKTFTKNDSEFICECCGKAVIPLKYTSRDHCPFCLVSKHVDNNPGDRSHDCKGLMLPIDISIHSGKKIITYKCSECGKLHNNKAAADDDFDTILKVMNKTYSIKEYNKNLK